MWCNVFCIHHNIVPLPRTTSLFESALNGAGDLLILAILLDDDFDDSFCEAVFTFGLRVDFGRLFPWSWPNGSFQSSPGDSVDEWCCCCCWFWKGQRSFSLRYASRFLQNFIQRFLHIIKNSLKRYYFILYSTIKITNMIVERNKND